MIFSADSRVKIPCILHLIRLGYLWQERKELPAHRIARLWKFQLPEVDDWVRAGGADEEKEHE